MFGLATTATRGRKKKREYNMCRTFKMKIRKMWLINNGKQVAKKVV
jgi:hypothetical protein